jgi:CBS domain-containing protein
MSDETSDTRDWTSLTARDLMQERVITVSYSAPLSEVERVLSDNRIGGVPVTDAAGHVVGVISARDLLDLYTEDPDARPRRGKGYYYLSSEDLDDVDFDSFSLPDESEATAESVMTAEAYTIGVSASLREVASLMAEHKIHRVLVTDDETGAIVGLISTMDLIRALGR